ncbi:NAD-dependent epimerase/dehydratase family protein [Treponema bryantii]|uniref:NAD-dependent epimerase/dehydratase family protein n=1 Tax=Treponema bryantii TaxID=163 RepID=UPI0003B6AB65|nr:NAD(P)-dependent oxidoreductase [Treponema bryantii]
MKILVTGANGYIGTGVVKALLQLKQDVIATDFIVDGIDTRSKTIAGDIFGLEKPFEYFEEPDVVLHLAWRNGFVHNSDTHLEDLPNHYKFLSKMAESGVKKIVALGSMHEIGFWEGRIREDTPCNPMSLYGISKNALREALELVCKQKNTMFQWIRGYYIVGNSEKGASIFSKITAAEKEGKTEFPFTTGRNQYDFIDYDEFCKQIANVIINNEVLGIINCCSGIPESLASRVERFIKDNNYKIKLNYGAFPDRPYDSLAVWGDNSKIQKILEQNEGK